MDDNDFMKMIKRLSADMESELLSTSTSTSTHASYEAEPLTMEKMMEAWDLVKDYEHPLIEAIVITKLVPAGGWQVKADGKEYILINRETWVNEWEKEIKKYEYKPSDLVAGLMPSLFAIKVFDSDEYAARIIKIRFDEDFGFKLYSLDLRPIDPGPQSRSDL